MFQPEVVCSNLEHVIARLCLYCDWKIFALLQFKATGSVLYQHVVQEMQLLEADYFGLEFRDMHGAPVRNYGIEIMRR